jgi:all-trans-retinol 13,14-reductase
MIRIGRRYGKFELASNWDAIVIGSGIGGLASAALLARHAGKRVLVLERHYMPGGFTHTYRRHGYEWDVGVHYLGEVGSQKSMTRRLFDHVGDGSLQWAPMGEIYDRVVIGDRVYDFPAGAAAFRNQLVGYFPGEAGAIDHYLALIRKVARAIGPYFAEKAVPPFVSATLGGLMRRPFLKWTRRTTREVLERLTGNQELIGVLTAQFGDYGLPPAESSFAMHAILARHYLRGGWYPIGGSSRIAASIAPTIETAGGEIVYQAGVDEILTDGGRATGVRLDDGTELAAPLVISDAGFHNTFLKLLPEGSARRQTSRLEALRIKPSVSHLCLYVGFKKSAAELGFEKTNLWLYPGPNHDQNVSQYLEDTSRELPLVYASFPSAKDPEFETNYPGRATMELITLASFEEFKPWLDTTWRQRGDDYEQLKATYTERMLARLDRQLPGVIDQIDYSELSTPLSTRYFANYERGELYGLDHSPARFEERSLRPRTAVKGLFLTGQDVATCGVASALVSGYLSASAALGRNLLGKTTQTREA